MERLPPGDSSEQMATSALQRMPTPMDHPPDDNVGASSPSALYETRLHFVWRNLRRLGVPPQQLEDAAQDVFLVVHRRWDTFDPTRSAVETWLFGIVMRVAHTYRRTLLRRLAWLVPWRGTVEPDAPSPLDGPSELLARRQAAQLFERVILEIKEDNRAVFLMVEVEELSVPEVALALHINTNTAYWRLREARMEFKKALARAHAAEGHTAGKTVKVLR
jgi:RNA polymerase sigma-70 factor (ECF subfamily)